MHTENSHQYKFEVLGVYSFFFNYYYISYIFNNFLSYQTVKT